MTKWHSLLSTWVSPLSAVAPFTPPPYDKVITTLGQVCILIAELAQVGRDGAPTEGAPNRRPFLTRFVPIAPGNHPRAG